MNRISEKFRQKISKDTDYIGGADCGCSAIYADNDCCGDEGKRVGFPPMEDSQGTLRSTQVPWLAIR